MIREYKRCPQKNQNGAILIVAIVLLLAMTLLSVSAVDGLSLQSQMARNSIESQTLYQISLSDIQHQFNRLRDPRFREHVRASSAITDNPSASQQQSGIRLTERDMQPLQRSIQYDRSGKIVLMQGDTAPLSGYSLNGFPVHHYEIHIVTRLPGTSSESNQTQGVAHVAPPHQTR